MSPDWSSGVALVEKVKNVGKAIDSYRSLDDRYWRRAEEHRTKAGILGSDEIPSSIVRDDRCLDPTPPN
jgi:hypothetical protein